MPTGYLISAVALCLALGGCVSTPSVPAPVAPTPDRLDFLDWMTGSWVSEDGTRRTEEYWTPPGGGTMFGVNRMMVDGQTRFFEYLRLSVDPETDTVTYYASPVGRHPATPFALTEHGRHSATFHNPGHDFPQTIIYRLDDDDTLHATISGTQDGEPRSSSWSWKRMR